MRLPKASGGQRAARAAARAARTTDADLYERAACTPLLAVAGSPDAALDSGSLAVAVARCWAAHGRDVTVVDAHPAGIALAGRLADAAGLALAPAVRGVPSLMAARQRVDAALLREHCWALDSPGAGTVRVLLGPSNGDGAALAAAWLAGRMGELLAANAGRSMIAVTAMPPDCGQQWLRSADATALVAPVGDDAQVDAVRSAAAALNEAAPGRPRCLVIDGAAQRSFEDIHAATGVHVAGRIDGADDAVMLSGRARRRHAGWAHAVAELAARLAFLAAQPAPDAGILRVQQ